MKSALSIVIAIAVPFCGLSQSSWQGGIEQDILPYATGGYYVAAWAGKGHVRGRALLAQVNKPSFVVPNGFTNNKVTAIAMIADYFPKDKWRGWHVGAGVVLWQSGIQSNLRQSTAYYNNFLVNGSIGYNWWFSPRFYLCPWAGLHLKVGGASTVTVDNQNFDTPLLTPEASIKVGWCF